MTGSAQRGQGLKWKRNFSSTYLDAAHPSWQQEQLDSGAKLIKLRMESFRVVGPIFRWLMMRMMTHLTIGNICCQIYDQGSHRWLPKQMTGHIEFLHVLAPFYCQIYPQYKGKFAIGNNPPPHPTPLFGTFQKFIRFDNGWLPY